jgi:hypothetical protein
MSRAAVLALAVAGLGACSPSPSSPSTLTLPLPQALVACAAVPDDLQARLWISGTSDPCFLDVDVAAGTTSGACPIAPGIERRVTLDWFIDVAGRAIVLAQAQGEVDLAGATDDVTFTVADDDIVTAGCKDMSQDSFAGSDDVDVDGAAVPVCDLDDDGVSNVDEVCAGDAAL